MAHSLITGRTESGKTTLAKMLAKTWKGLGRKIVVLDPLQDPEWKADFETADPSEFLAFVKSNQNCTIFVDEGATSIGRYNDQMIWLATTSRHLGHNCYFISHRITQLPVSLSAQCTRAFLFASTMRDAEYAVNERGDKKLWDVANLPKGEFFIASSYEKLRRGRLDFAKKTFYYLPEQ